jgi:hypothetical protein
MDRTTVECSLTDMEVEALRCVSLGPKRKFHRRASRADLVTKRTAYDSALGQQSAEKQSFSMSFLCLLMAMESSR